MISRRKFLVGAGLMTGVGLAELRSPAFGLPRERVRAMSDQGVDYTLHIKSSPIEIAPRRIVSAIAYNGQFPGPLLRFKENRPVTVDIFNETDTPEQLDWHGQKVGVDVDGAAEEGTPPIPAQGMRRISFTPNPSGLRFYHTHDRAGANLAAGRYGGEVGPVYIEPAQDPGRYDREIFLVLKDFEPTFRRGGDMNRDFLTPAQVNPELKGIGESSMKASLAKGRPHGYEVGYRSFTINRRMLGHGEPLRVKAGDRLRLHVLNGSATESHPRFSPASLRGSVFLQPVWIPRFDGHAR